jgi:ABC-2 type transport system ATP-binding protein
VTAKPKVVVQDLRKRYDTVEAVRGVSFEIGDGEIFGLLGPNGAGKTTTVECIIGLREADAGDIHVCGVDARRHPREVKQRIGAALQTTALQDKITPREALALFGSFYGRSAAPVQLLDRFAIADKADAPFDSLSGGQRQRLALALAFVNEPELVFLDEPTAGLDPQSRRELHDEILRMKRDGHTVLLTTHYLDEAEALCDRVAIINRGQIAAAGPPRELTARASAAPTVELWTVVPLDRELFAGLTDGGDVELTGTRARFSTSRATAAVAELMKRLDARRIDIVELKVRKASLETLFLELTETQPSPEPRSPSPDRQ